MPKRKKASQARPVAPSPARSAASRKPWVIGGIDYGPAILAVSGLAEWAFELAASDVEDWPEGRRRVRNARRYVLDRLRGRHARGVGTEDVLFTAGLLARIFEAELSLGVSEMIAILDELGLPTDVVPMAPRRQSMAFRRDNVVSLPVPRRADEGRPASGCRSCRRPRRFRNAA